MSAFVAAVTFVVVTFLTQSPILGAAAAGFVGGVTYGLMSGAGIKASLQMGGWGALFAVGAMVGAQVFGPVAATLMKYASLGLSVARDGWEGVINYYAGLTGAHLGQKVGNSIVGKIQNAGSNSPRELKAYPNAGNKPHFDFGEKPGNLADNSNMSGNGGADRSDGPPNNYGIGGESVGHLQSGQPIGSVLNIDT